VDTKNYKQFSEHINVRSDGPLQSNVTLINDRQLMGGL